MCRNIKVLRQPERPPTDEEIHLAALQFVRKVSGYRQPSRKNSPAFDQAVQDVFCGNSSTVRQCNRVSCGAVEYKSENRSKRRCVQTGGDLR